ncbi:MAG: hypothetical protein U1E30_14355 [Rhodoblastus sp.]|mgnify:FL=1
MHVALEIVDRDKTVLGRLEMHVFDETHVWSRVVAVARRLQQRDGVRIRVLDDAGGILVLTSATGALLVDQAA